MIYFPRGLSTKDQFSVHNEFDIISKPVIHFYSYQSILIEMDVRSWEQEKQKLNKYLRKVKDKEQLIVSH